MPNATRLLVLGAIRVMQPVHGYDVRRELVSWRLEEVSNVKPGSIYGAIRTLEKDGCVAVHSQSASDNRPEKTQYVLTDEGEKEFQLLLRQTWWHVDLPVEPLMPGLAMLPFIPRDELILALQSRLSALRAQLGAYDYQRGTIEEGATGSDGQTPEHVREVLGFLIARIRAEIDWAKQLHDRLRAGKYHFSGEGDFAVPKPGRGLAQDGRRLRPDE